MWKHTLVFLTLTEKLIKALSKTQPNKQKKEKGAESSWNVSSIINYSALTLFCWCFRCRVLQLKIVHPSLSPLHKGTKTEDGECHCPLLLRSCKERHILLYVVLPFETAIDAFVSFFFFLLLLAFTVSFLSLASSVRSMKWKRMETASWPFCFG